MPRIRSWPAGFGLALLYPPSQNYLIEHIRADLVFVHGLNGSPEHTWHAKAPDGSDVCWLNDNKFLPSQIPFSRIFTFKYNARAVHYRSDARLENIASSLLAHLQSVRVTREEQRRPLIFVCHSLGGLVVKQMLVLKHQSHERRDIQDASTAILFLGTPHGGSHLARTLAKMTTILGSPRHLVDILTVGSSSSANLSEEFADYYRERLQGTRGLPALKIASFAEMQNTSGKLPFIAAQVVPIKYARTYLKGEDYVEVEKDHRSICRFETPDDPVYRMIYQRLSKWTSGPHISHTLEDIPHDKYYHVPFRTDRFVGRQQELEKMDQSLSHRNGRSQRSLAIHGFGSQGKTQLALRYAFTHDEEYSTIWLFNARSEADLRTGMEGFFDFLIQRNDERLNKLGKGTKDKINAVLQWLEEERESLIIYDDIDLEMPFDIRAYYPQRATGHRIMISRQPGVADYAECTLQLNPMSDYDAASMLLLRSDRNVLNNWGEIPEVATKIVSELDNMPGFIEIAARYILHRRINLWEYYRILLNQKQNMRLASPKGLLGDAFASWNIAFKALPQASTSMLLLKFFAFLDGSSLSLTSLRRATAPCLRWARDGHWKERLPEWSGIDDRLIQVLKDDEAFNEALTPLINASFLRREQTDTESVIQIPQPIQRFVRRAINEDEELSWVRTAAAAVCHALPEDPKLETNFETVRATLTPHVLRCIENAQLYKIEQLGQPLLRKLTFMLLVTLARSGMELDYLDQLVEQCDDGAYRCAAAKWRAYAYFFKDRKDEAERLLATAQHREESLVKARSGQPENARSHAALGDLIMHRVQFLFGREVGCDAVLCESILHSWKPYTTSPLEERTELHVDTARTRMLALQGRYDEAVQKLESLVARPQRESPVAGAFEPSDLNWATVILSQLYCVQEKFETLTKLLQPKVDKLILLNAVSEFITSDFRILLCEAKLRQHNLPKAHLELTRLREDLGLASQITNPRVSAQLLKVTSRIARAYHLQKDWSAAAAAWKEVLLATGVNVENLRQEKHFNRARVAPNLQILVTASLYSLGVTCHFRGDRITARHYISLAEQDPNYQTVPSGKLDYTAWYSTVRAEYETALQGRVWRKSSTLKRALCRD